MITDNDAKRDLLKMVCICWKNGGWRKVEEEKQRLLSRLSNGDDAKWVSGFIDAVAVAIRIMGTRQAQLILTGIIDRAEWPAAVTTSALSKRCAKTWGNAG